MTFGEKLFKLRKEKGLSQEALAEQLNTTRQAISKWENNQGYPETEKLLMLSNIFEVQVDSLLKENPEPLSTDDKGYYVSKECAEGFLIYGNRATRRIAAGVSTIIMSGIPYFIMGEDTILSVTLTSVIMLLGLAIILTIAFTENPYKRLKRERLLFDPAYFMELQTKYKIQKRKYFYLIMVGISLVFITGITELAIDELITHFPTETIQCLLISMSVYCFIWVIGITDLYDILLKSEERMDKFYRRVIKKINRKIDN